ncbi:hypothetical protein BCR42DRAFT_396961 [Absidia repens]|uniref:Uncharacterized protein n=1 Tax=Absidia repens TaxID=90262 RepID=A0A1X2I354_9FUNG|nr:hypothetical protein BCR42DRAFT_396961 [Absidia repens]
MSRKDVWEFMDPTVVLPSAAEILMINIVVNHVARYLAHRLIVVMKSDRAWIVWLRVRYGLEPKAAVLLWPTQPRGASLVKFRIQMSVKTIVHAWSVINRQLINAAKVLALQATAIHIDDRQRKRKGQSKCNVQSILK